MLTKYELEWLTFGDKNTVEACGSRVTNPKSVRKDSDWDYLVIVGAGERNYEYDILIERPYIVLSDFIATLVGDYGWTLESGIGGHYQAQAAETFVSLRKDDNNLIVSTSPEFARRHRAATHVCKLLDLDDKQDRIVVFQAVLYGNEHREF